MAVKAVRQPHISFVVVAYNNDAGELSKLVELLLSTARARSQKADVHLVMNDLSTIEVGPGAHVHSGHGNVGFARGVSIGVAAAKGDYVVLLNPDCHPDSAMLSRFLELLSPGCGILVPKILTADGAMDYWAYQNWTFTPGRKLSQWRCARSLPRLGEGPLPTYAKAPGAFLGMETRVAQELGPFDDAFFLYAEDRDLTDRARHLGVPISFVPRVTIRHVGGVSSGTVPQVVAASKVDGYLRIAHRRYGRFGVIVAIVDLMLLAASSRVLRRESFSWGAIRPVVARWKGHGFREPSRFDADPRHARNLRGLVLWSDNTAANLGLRVLAAGSGQAIVEAAPGTHVDWQDFGPGDSSASFGTKAIVRDLLSRRPITAKLAQYDFVLDSGAGDSFTDIYGLKRLCFISYAHWRCRRRGIPVLLGPQTIGPFNTRTGRWLGAKTIAQARFISARDEQSADYCKVAFGREVDLVTSDLVFTLPPEDASTRRDVLLNVSGLLWFSDDHGPSAHYRRETCRLVEELRGIGREVSLLGHVVHSPSGNDDLDAIRELQARSTSAAACEVIDPQDLRDVRRQIAGASLVIGARMHAVLNALSQGVPAIPWAYSRKFEPLMEALDWPHVVDVGRDADHVARTLDLVSQISSTPGAAADVAVRGRQLVAPAVEALARQLSELTPGERPRSA